MLALSACAQVGASTLPPPEFRDPSRAFIMFTDNVGRDCEQVGVQTIVLVTRVEACTVFASDTIIIPNPCRWEKFDPYARLLCHELGHVNGWKH